ncbi:MAG: hypothetical protein NTZ78_01615 [Candidatus Aureabacteria bacterium]|nr:hypothetical protein [Candidatus Auribacterota bacterium]
MRIHRKEVIRLKKAESIVQKVFPRFGVNKQREISRLLYEISRRENISPQEVIRTPPSGDFKKVKETLVKRRFPHASLHGELPPPFLPGLSLDPSARALPGENDYSPREVVVEQEVAHSWLSDRVRSAFPDASFSEVPSMKRHLAARTRFTLADYSKRRDLLFIVSEPHDFFKRCPCTKGAVPCGYHVFNLGFGCIYDCTYCFLQEYVNTPGIVLPANIEDYFDSFVRYRRSPRARAWHRGGRMRIGTGEFSDSLMLDHITGYSSPIIDFFKKHLDTVFEFKTKSARIENFLDAPHGGNIILSWSLNPQGVIDTDEFHTASLRERLRSAGRAAAAGYRVGFHFDPVLYFQGWERAYAEVIDAVFQAVRPRDIAWISIGTLRFSPGLKQVIENRFPENKILDGELLPGYDRKLRYPDSIRYPMYEKMIEKLRKHSREMPLYLCMEEKSIWRRVGIIPPFTS